MDKTREYISIINRYKKRLRPRVSHVQTRGSLTRSIRAVLFDIYGTLFISGSGDVDVAEKKVTSKELASLLKRYGVLLDAEKAKMRYFQEIAKKHAELRQGGIDFPEVEIDSIWKEVLGFEELDKARKFALEYVMLFNPVWPMPFLRPMLRRLREKKVEMGIISNAQFYTALLFQLFLGSSQKELGFNERLIIYSFEHGRAKPSPILFDKARKQLKGMGITPEFTLYVGNDMLNDIYPAHKVGFQTALFAGDCRSLRLREDDERCRCICPDLVVRNLKDLSEHIIST